MPAYKNDYQAGTWCAKFRYKNWKGEVKYITKRGFRTKKEACEWERSFLQREAGDLDMTFEDFAKLYMEERFPRLKESTRDSKENIIQTKLIPYFGSKKISEITSADVIKWQNEILAYRSPDTHKPYSATYLRSIHCQLCTIFNYAVRHYNLRNNPANIAGSIGSKNRDELNFWTKEEYLRFAEVIMDKPLAYYCFEVLYWCGIREGELLALTYEDIDMEKCEIYITKTYHRKHGQDIITDPKTPRSRRKVSIPEFLRDELKDYLEMCYEPSKTDRIFPVSKSFLRNNLIEGAKKASLPIIRVHDLRHSHVSLLIDMGFSALAIAERVGHESVDITYRYAHLFPSVQTQMAKSLDKLKEVR